MLTSRVLTTYNNVRVSADWLEDGRAMECRCSRCMMGQRNGTGFRVLKKNGSRVTVELVTPKEQTPPSTKPSSENTLPLVTLPLVQPDIYLDVRGENREKNREKLSPSVVLQTKFSPPDVRLVLSAPPIRRESPCLPKKDPGWLTKLKGLQPKQPDEQQQEEEEKKTNPYLTSKEAEEKTNLYLISKEARNGFSVLITDNAVIASQKVGDIDRSIVLGKPVIPTFAEKLGKPLIENITPAVRDVPNILGDRSATDHRSDEISPEDPTPENLPIFSGALGADDSGCLMVSTSGSQSSAALTRGCVSTNRLHSKYLSTKPLHKVANSDGRHLIKKRKLEWQEVEVNKIPRHFPVRSAVFELGQPELLQLSDPESALLLGPTTVRNDPR